MTQSTIKLSKVTLEERKNLFLIRAREVHGETYNYEKIKYVTSLKKVEIICAKHGEFLQSPNSHVKGTGCPKCSGTGTRHNQNDVIDSFKKVHGDTYSYEMVNYVNNSTPVKIICKKHGEFSMSPNKHKSGRGCQKCSKITSISKMSATKTRKQSSRKLTLAEFLRRAYEVHGDNFDYTLVDTFPGLHSKIRVICKEHGEFQQRAEKHLMGRGCPVCKKSRQYSKMSKIWLDSLGIETLIREYRLPENKLIPVDGYDPVTNTIYQFHGDYWHGGKKFEPSEFNKTRGLTFAELRVHSDDRDEQLKEFGYNLVIMWESDFKESLYPKRLS